MITAPFWASPLSEPRFGNNDRKDKHANPEQRPGYSGIKKAPYTPPNHRFQNRNQSRFQDRFQPKANQQNGEGPSAPVDNAQPVTAPSPGRVVPQLPKPFKFCFPTVTDTFEYKTRTIVGNKKEQTQVQSLIGGGQLFQKIDETLNKAKSWVLIDLYNMQSPALYPDRHSPQETPGADLQAGLVQKLVDLKQRNVKVRVILDNSKQVVQPPFTLDPEHNARTLKFLRDNGIETVTYPRELSRINHSKVLLVDNKHAVVSGMNWGNHSPTNHDGGVYIEGPDARNVFHKVFKPDWITSGGDASKLPTITPFRQGNIQVLQTSGEGSEQGPKDEILQAILSQISKAQSSIHAELFVLTNKRVVDSLIEKHAQLKAAGKEGVKLLVDPGLYFKFPNCRPGIQKLAKAGVPIRFMESDRTREEKLHAKWAVFDRKNILMGSANWSAVGLESKGTTDEYIPLADEAEADENAMEGVEPRPIVKGNHEVDVLIENSPNVAGTFARQASYDFKHHSFPIMEKGSDDKWHPIRPFWFNKFRANR